MVYVDSTGTLPTDLMFAGKSFSSCENVDALYRFDSYRLTWRYTLKNRSDFLFKLGLAAKIRDTAGSETSVPRGSVSGITIAEKKLLL